MNKLIESLNNMRDDVIDFRDIIKGSSYSTDNDYENIKQALIKAEATERELEELKEKINELYKKAKENRIKFENKIFSSIFYLEHRSKEVVLEELIALCKGSDENES